MMIFGSQAVGAITLIIILAIASAVLVFIKQREAIRDDIMFSEIIKQNKYFFILLILGVVFWFALVIRFILYLLIIGEFSPDNWFMVLLLLSVGSLTAALIFHVSTRSQ